MSTRLALSQTNITVTHPDGTTEQLEKAYLHVRRGEAMAKVGTTETTMAVAGEVQQVSRREYRITGTDGTVWAVTRIGGCGCGR